MRRVWTALIVSVFFASAASALSEGEQTTACMGDAFRLCVSEIPDRQAVRRCMGVKRDQLSAGCRLAYDSVLTDERRTRSVR